MMINIHDGLLRHALLCVVGGDDIACDKAIRSDIETISFSFVLVQLKEKLRLMRRSGCRSTEVFIETGACAGVEED